MDPKSDPNIPDVSPPKASFLPFSSRTPPKPSKSYQKEPKGNQNEPKRTHKDSKIIEIHPKRTSKNVKYSRNIEFLLKTNKSNNKKCDGPALYFMLFGFMKFRQSTFENPYIKNGADIRTRTGTKTLATT